MNRILVLWGVPRSTSTAFEWMMRMRGDMSCFHEPFGEPWYRGEEPLWPRITPTCPRVPGLTFESVWAGLRDAAEKGPVFCKDFPHYIKHWWETDSGFLRHFTHSFLIRHPAKVIPSMFRHWPEFLPEETAFAEQRELFELLCDRDGVQPPVIDSDDLLEDPLHVVQAYCRAVGIPFIEEALHWESGDRDEVSWYDGGSWHHNLKRSDGLKTQPAPGVDMADLPARMKAIHEACLPHYDYLHSCRLKV